MKQLSEALPLRGGLQTARWRQYHKIKTCNKQESPSMQRLQAYKKQYALPHRRRARRAQTQGFV